jgi:Tol biopolymer transport system component
VRDFLPELTIRQRFLCVLAAVFITSACALFHPLGGETPEKVASGWLAYIGADGNVYIQKADFSERRQITTDANTYMEGVGRSYHRLAWSPDGSLAYAAVERDDTSRSSQIFTSRLDAVEPRLVASNDENFVIYLHWSPVNCSYEDGCVLMAYLINEGEHIGLRTLQVEGDKIEDRLVAFGRPTYFTWHPDGERLLIHTGGVSGRDTPNSLQTYHIRSRESFALDLEIGEFPAPAWSPDGAHALLTLADGAENTLSLLTISDDGVTAIQPLVSARAEIVFAWSPHGDQIAYAERDRLGGRAYGPVQVHDLATGHTERITPESLPLLGFFWSPNGKRLAYLTRLEVEDDIWMQWRVIEVESQVDAGFASFRPSPGMAFMINSFNQYAQSDRFWSPDGHYLVYADRDETFVDRIWLVDTGNLNDRDPIFVDEGAFGIWSFHE